MSFCLECTHANSFPPVPTCQGLCHPLSANFPPDLFISLPATCHQHGALQPSEPPLCNFGIRWISAMGSGQGWLQPLMPTWTLFLVKNEHLGTFKEKGPAGWSPRLAPQFALCCPLGRQPSQKGWEIAFFFTFSTCINVLISRLSLLLLV